MPQALQPLLLQLWQMYLVWVQWGEAQQYRREPMAAVPQASMRSMRIDSAFLLPNEHCCLIKIVTLAV